MLADHVTFLSSSVNESFLFLTLTQSVGLSAIPLNDASSLMNDLRILDFVISARIVEEKIIRKIIINVVIYMYLFLCF